MLDVSLSVLDVSLSVFDCQCILITRELLLHTMIDLQWKNNDGKGRVAEEESSKIDAVP